MQDLNFLVVGTNTEILNTLHRVIQQNYSWKASICNKINDFYDVIHQQTFDVVLLSCGIPNLEEQAIQEYTTVHFPNTKTIMHFGGGSGLLKSEVFYAFNQEIK